MNKRLNSRGRLSGSSMNWFYVPALLIMFFFLGVPLLNALRLSMYKWNGYSKNQIFIGLKNYADFLKDRNLRRAFSNTLLYGIGSTVIQNALGLAAALFVDSKFKGHTVVRVFIYMPIMIASLLMGYIVYYFVQFDHGILNEILGWFGKAPVDWLRDAKRATWIITLVNGWQYCGNSMVIYLAGLQSIPAYYYEAAELDGSNAWQRFRYVTLPLLVPAITSAVVINLIGSLKLHDPIIALTNGGPALKTHSLSTYISYTYFQMERAGYSSAIGITMFVFIMVLAFIVNKYFRGREVEY